MGSIWLDRGLVEEQVPGVEFTALKYGPDTGQYCLDGVPFTGVSKVWGRDGSLQRADPALQRDVQ